MWYQLSLQKVIKETDSDDTNGLSTEEANKRLQVFGPNTLPNKKRGSWLTFFLTQFKSPLVYILLIGAVLTAWLREWVDMGVILLAVTVNVAVGFWQEYKSNNVLEKLNAIVHTRTTVIRNGKTLEINTNEVVPGDIIKLQPGTSIPADARILEAHRLEVNEAAMTGESAPAGKRVVEITDEVAIGDRDNMVHMGTTVTRGEGKALVVTTGSNTELGKIALLTEQAEDEATPLQVRIGKLGQKLAIIFGIVSVLIFVVGILENHSFKEMFTTAIAVAVAAIPEGLPAAISIVLAVSAQRILKKDGVVKHLLAAETLGSTSVICADKTGTLTEGKMKVEKCITEGDENYFLRTLALANEAYVEEKDNTQVIRGEMTDQAKLQAFLDSGGNLTELLATNQQKALFRFDPARKYLASLSYNSKINSNTLFVSGAPETLLMYSSSIIQGETAVPLSEEKKSELTATFTHLAEEGYRVIATADKVLEEEIEKDIDLEETTTHERLFKELRFVGLAAIRDPIREDVRESMKTSREAGIRSIMLTGDHLLTAKAIGAELGFKTEEKAVMDGVEIRSLSEEALEIKLKTVEICARVNPEDKLRIVELLQKQGEVVAMTGDGVNDAPSLKSADIGVAVNSGSDVSKEASDLILLNDSFSIIVEAIKQGRIAFDNIRKVTVFLLAGSFTELLLILSSLILRIPLPVTAVMILWTNLVEDTLPNVALSFEPGEHDIMKRKPIGRKEPILDGESKIIVFVVGIVTDIVLISLFLFLFYTTSLPLEHIQTIIFAGLGLDTFFYIYSIKSLREPIYRYNPFNNLYLVGATVIGVGLMVAAIYAPFLNAILGTVPLSLGNWGIIVALGLLKLFGVEVAKWWFFHREWGRKGNRAIV